MSEDECPIGSSPRSGAVPPIAIVGIGCHFPGARGPESLWRLIVEGRCAVDEVPQHRIELGYSVDRYFDPRPRIPGRISSSRAGFIEHPELFDPAPFGLTPRDAAAMEPQARMMLEVVWDAIEDAGLRFEALRGERVAVLVGHTAEDFSRERIAVLGEDAAMRGMDVRTAVGYSRAAISGRISHLLDLRGPSLTLDTACSSSLYATHLACHSIWRGESKLALAGGVNLFLTPEGSLALSRSGMMAPDGHCKAFDARADGFVRAEGAGVVLLRPLADAQANGDPIYALIRGCGVSCDGRDGGHMMAPGASGQAQAMRDAYRLTDFSGAQVDFVEAHGTGTPIGDPVEIAALAEVLGEGRRADRPLRISSIKGNIGHAESASGAAGLIKAALAIEHRVVPAQLHFETPNPRIDWNAAPIQVQTQPEPWPHADVARAGVNSFGISGTNAHVVLEGAPDRDELAAPTREQLLLLPLTAHDPNALSELAALHLERLRAGRPDQPLAGYRETPPCNPIRFADLGYTLARRRTHHRERLTIVADSPEALGRELEAYRAGAPSPACQSGSARATGPERLVFVFPGQGGQWLGMGRDLLDGAPAFRASIERWDRLYRHHVDWSLLEVLRDPRGEGRPIELLCVLQPVLVALQIALAELLAEYGIVPDAVLGQSLGELAAAAVSAALPRDDIARLACRRGAAVERAGGSGAMALIALPEDEVNEILAKGVEGVEVAGQNGPTRTLIAGDRAPVLSIVRDLETRDVFARPLDVDFASHCFHMDPLLDDFATEIEGLAPREGRIPFYSSVEGGGVPGGALNAQYWVRNLRQKVRFVDAVQAALGECKATFVEISAHPTLARPIDEIAASLGRDARTLPTLCRGQSSRETLLRLLGALFVTGHPVDMKRLYPNGRSVRLPLYPYQKRELWFGTRRRAHRRAPTHPLLATHSRDAEDPHIQRWQTLIDLDVAPALELAERDAPNPLPASFCIEIALAVAAELWPKRTAHVERLGLAPGVGGRRMQYEHTDPRLALQVHFEAIGEDRGQLRLYARPFDRAETNWLKIAEAELVARTSAEAPTDEARSSQLAQIRERCPKQVNVDWPRAALARAGAAFARRVDGLRALRLGDGELLAEIEIPAACRNDVGHYRLHPAILEMGIALAGCVLEPSEGGPFARRIHGISSFARCPQSAFCHARLRVDSARIDLAFYAESGECLAQVEGLATRCGPAARSASHSRFVHRLVWSPANLDEPESTQAASQSPHTDADRWIVAADDDTTARAYSRALGERCIGVSAIDALRVRALAETARRSEPDRAPGLILVADGTGSAPGRGVDDEARLERLLACLGLHESPLARIAVVTRGVCARADRAPLVEASSAVAWGIASTRAEEGVDPEPQTTAIATTTAITTTITTGITTAITTATAIAIDLAPAECAEDAATRVVTLLNTQPKGGSYAWGANGWLEPRLTPAEVTPADVTPEDVEPAELAPARVGATEQRAGVAHTPFTARLEPGAPGERRALLYTKETPQPGPGEVVVRVRAAALTQLDIRSALGCGASPDFVSGAVNRGARPGAPGLGRECAGVITALGENVKTLRVGDAVVGFAHNALSSELLAPAEWITRIPDGLAFDAAAALPLAFVVAQHTLLELARLAPGERVLVLAGGGGVGLAATRVASQRGARVLAAASSERRRAALRASGAERTCAARASALTRTAEEWTHGNGLDVVLSSAEDERFERTLECLAPGGRFVDLRPLCARSATRMPSLRGNRALFSFDFDDWIEASPQSVGPALRRAIDGAARDAAWQLPRTTFPVGELARALRYGAQDRQVGRITIDFASHGALCPKALPTPNRVSSELRHWISGAHVRDLETRAQWLAERGAQALLLYPTRPLGEQRAVLFERLAARGVHIDMVKGNEAEALLELGRESSGLGSVTHVLDDAATSPTEIVAEARFMRALEAAVRSVPTLRLLLVHPAHDIFGSRPDERCPDAPGVHRGLRVFADALCRQRRRRGGMAASVGVTDPSGGLAGAGRRAGQAMGLLAFDARGADGVVIAADPEDWPAASAGTHSLLRDIAKPAGDAGGRVDPVELARLGPKQRAARLLEVAEERVANVLALSGGARARLDHAAPLADLGLDSLMATELSVLITADLGVSLPPAIWAERPSLRGLVAHLENAVASEATLP